MPDDRDTSPCVLRTADGIDLEAELAMATAPPPGPHGPRSLAVLLAHPHPAQGGSMRSLVTSELFRAMPAAGVTALRFNFRGVEGSGGAHGGGLAEHLDVEAGIAHLASVVPRATLVVAGWSFGADVALTVVDPRLSGWFLIAPPLRVVPLESMLAGADPRPKRLVIGEHDQFRPPDAARPLVAAWQATEVVTIPGADHFFAGRTDRVAAELVDFVANVASP